MAEESGHLRVLRIKSEILPRCAPQDDRQNEILRWAQDDKAAVFRTTGQCHSEAGFMGEESGVKDFQKQNQVLRSAQDDRAVSF